LERIFFAFEFVKKEKLKYWPWYSTVSCLRCLYHNGNINKDAQDLCDGLKALILQHEKMSHHIFYFFGTHALAFGGRSAVRHVYQNRFTTGRKARIGYEPGDTIFNGSTLCHRRYYCLQVVEKSERRILIKLF
jgi:hypothetical protein